MQKNSSVNASEHVNPVERNGMWKINRDKITGTWMKNVKSHKNKQITCKNHRKMNENIRSYTNHSIM